MGTCTPISETAPWRPNASYLDSWQDAWRASVKPDYKSMLAPVPAPFSWGTNGPLILLLALEAPFLALAIVLWAFG